MAGHVTSGAQDQVDEAGAALTIDLDALAANWRLLRDRARPAECGAVVKADAYGIGIEQAVPALAEAGCRTFFVAHVGEGRRLRAVAPEATLYILNGLLPGQAEAIAAMGARPILGSFEELEDWAATCRNRGERLPAALHVDTGMNRLGFEPDAAAALAADPRLAEIAPALLMSHLTSAEDSASPATARQTGAFAAIRSAFPGIPASLSNSAGLFVPDPPRHDLARPGYALYGGNPTPGLPNPMRPVVRLEARIVQLREIGPGEPVGYNGAWTSERPRRLATLSVGYADGYVRSASATDGKRAAAAPSGAALVAGRLCPFAGRVSMDLIIVDVSDVPGRDAVRGAVATLIGDALDIDEVGRRAGTIGYEILTGLGSRYGRRYLGGAGG